VVRPIVVQPADLPRFSARLEAVLSAMGSSDAAIRGAIQVLAESVSGFDPFGNEAQRVMSQAGQGIKEEINRPWRWFAKACEVANEQGDYELPPRVFMLTAWFKNMQPKLTMADFADMRLDRVPEDAHQAISRTAAEALAHLSDDHTVAQTAAEVVTVGQLRGFGPSGCSRVNRRRSSGRA
jgi:hypothetical protein